MDGDELVLDLLKESRDSLKDLSDKFATIEKCLVGRENCAKYMEDHDTRLRIVEAVCTTYMATRDQTIDGEELLSAKNEAIQEAKKGQDETNKRLEAIEKKIAPFDLTWQTVKSNPVMGAFATLLSAIAAGVYWGRVNDLISMYGIHIALIIISSILIVLILIWMGRRKVAAAMDKGREVKFWSI
jgi:hypothetical protein